MLRNALLAAAGVVVLAAPASARDFIRIVGSSTVFPFTTTVAEQFGFRTEFATPVVESTGTGGGLQLFCSGVGENYPDVTNASRRIKRSELEMCWDNGVDEVVEIKVGFDGIVIANAKTAPQFELTTRQVFQALAAELPASEEDCARTPNANTHWTDIDPDLPPLAIEVFGPPPTSGTRDAFVELAMEAGAAQFACLADLAEQDDAAFQAVAHKVREDGAWIDSGENDNTIVQTLRNNPSAIGVFGFSFLDQNSDRIHGAAIDGADPTYENISSGEYVISRSMYVYLKAQHADIVPGLQDFAREYVSEDAFGPFGYLAERGLIALSDEGRDEVRARVETLTGMSPQDAETLR